MGSPTKTVGGLRCSVINRLLCAHQRQQGFSGTFYQFFVSLVCLGLVRRLQLIFFMKLTEQSTIFFSPLMSLCRYNKSPHIFMCFCCSFFSLPLHVATPCCVGQPIHWQNKIMQEFIYLFCFVPKGVAFFPLSFTFRLSANSLIVYSRLQPTGRLQNHRWPVGHTLKVFYFLVKRPECSQAYSSIIKC